MDKYNLTYDQFSKMLTDESFANAGTSGMLRDISGLWTPRDVAGKAEYNPDAMNAIRDKIRANKGGALSRWETKDGQPVLKSNVEGIPDWAVEYLAQQGYDTSLPQKTSSGGGGAGSREDPVTLFENLAQSIESDPSMWDKYGASRTGKGTTEYDVNKDAVTQLRERATQVAANEQALQDRYNTITNSIANRYESALTGEMGLNPQKQKEYEALRNAVAAKGGRIEGDDPATAVATGTMAEGNLRAFNERWASQDNAERASLASQLGGATGLLNYGLPSQFNYVNAASGYGQLAGQNMPSLLSGAQGGQQPYTQQRQLGYQTDLSNTQNDQSRQQGAWNLGGQVGGMLLNYYLPGAGTLANSLINNLNNPNRGQDQGGTGMLPSSGNLRSGTLALTGKNPGDQYYWRG